MCFTSFIDCFSKKIKNNNYYIKDIIVLKSKYKNSLQSYLLNNLTKLHSDEIIKLIILKFFPNFYFRFIFKNKRNYSSIKKIFKKYNYNVIYETNINKRKLVNFIKKRNYSFIINTANLLKEEGVGQHDNGDHTKSEDLLNAALRLLDI